MRLCSLQDPRQEETFDEMRGNYSLNKHCVLLLFICLFPLKIFIHHVW